MKNPYNNSDTHRYDDIIQLPHHVSSTHPQMSMLNRAAQFSPFAALTGYDGQVKEAARLTDRKAELSENEKEVLDQKLQLISGHLKERPTVSVTYFVPDAKKDGGSYVMATGIIRKIDVPGKKITFYAENAVSDGLPIAIEDICDIDSDIFAGIILP